MSDFKYPLVEHTERNIDTAHNKPDVDLTKPFKAADGVYVLGTLLKTVAGKQERWVQGTDAVGLITGVYVHHQDIDTAKMAAALVRVEGTVARVGLVAATAANGSTTAAPTQAALDALEARQIYAL